MTSIVRKFKTFGTEQQRRRTLGGEVCANNLRREWEDMDKDADRLVGQTRQIIDRERMREGER